MIRSLLVANRGEIAVRILRTCREMGIRSVAVFSEADRCAQHVLDADQAYLIGPAPSSESYLRIDRILEAAQATGVEAIHPGYGFLAEREAFSRAVSDAGLTFVGPSAETIRVMGDKTQARKQMEAAGVPIVPGGVDAVGDADEARRWADDIGYPVLLKAAAGGGGKGMRVVHAAAEVGRAFDAARREAEAAFGDGSVYVERYLSTPRHIEIQLLGDSTGRVVHLGERECSIQRRHQKLIEEAPSAVLTPDQRQAMGAAAVRAAEAVDYLGAGTVEFLFEKGAFYFLEMNTRLQVEHPVTELVTGLDLVEWQIRIAGGEPIPFTQEQIDLSGHAIECRITSEAPFSGFLPSTGRIDRLRVPSGPGVRWDGGVLTGTEVGLHYDPLLAKLIVHAADRPAAIRRMGRALAELEISGIESSVPFHSRVMAHPSFEEGNLTIRFVDDHPELTRPREMTEGEIVATAVAAALLEDGARSRRPPPRIQASSNSAMSDWRAGSPPWGHRGPDGS